MLRTSVIIPTLDRPEDLGKCITSILDQTMTPDEVLVIDDGDMTAPPLREECESRGIRYLYHKKATRGLTASRNAGIRLASGDIIFFLDDDVVLFPDYIEEILNVFRQDPDGAIGGVSGDAVNLPLPSLKDRVRYVFSLLFLVKGLREGRVLPSGFFTEPKETFCPIRDLTEVDFLPGGISAYRRSVLDEFAFSEDYRGYGLGEDMDFSYRVSRKYTLMRTPKARLSHYQSPVMRYDKKRMGREFIITRYRFFRDHMCARPWRWVFFYYAMFGYVLSRAIIMLLSADREEASRMAGILGALRDIVHGKALDAGPATG